MGWNGAGDIFDPIGRIVGESVKNSQMAYSAGKSVLVALIATLRANDWDTEDESLETLGEYPVVVDSFAELGVRRPKPETREEMFVEVLRALETLDVTFGSQSGEVKSRIANDILNRLQVES